MARTEGGVMGRAATGSVRKLPSKRWQARFTYPDGIMRSAPTTFDTKSAATAWLAEQRTDVLRHQWLPASDATVATTFEDYANAWLANREVKGRPLADRTREGYRDLLNRLILPTFGHLALHTITRDTVEGWYRKTARNRPTYRARAYSLLRTILGSAIDDGHVEGPNPARIRGAGSVERKHEVRVLDRDEYRTLLQAIPERYRLMIQIATWCALRFGELTELRRGDIDTAKGVIRVRRAVVMAGGKFVVKTPKSAAGSRDVAIPPSLLPDVAAHLLQHTAPGADGLLFPSRKDPTEHLRQSSLARVFYPARGKAGRPDLRFHDLRHTGAVLAAQAGATPAETMARLGHSTVAAAMRYQHAADGRDAIIAARLDERLTAWRSG